MRIDNLACHVQRRLAPPAFQLAARCKKHRRHAAVTRQTHRPVHQACVRRVNAAALQPHARQLDMLAKAAAREGLAGMGEAQRGDVPADEFSLRCKVNHEAVFSQTAVVADRLQRQPFKPRLVLQVDAGGLQCGLPKRPVETRRARCGDEAMGVAMGRNVNRQRVAADQSARWMHQHVVANGVAFRIKALQNAKRAGVLVAGHGADWFDAGGFLAVGLYAVVKFKVGVPRHAVSVFAEKDGLNTEADCPAQMLVDFDAEITREDKDILESTDPDALVDPCRRGVEYSMDSDRPGILIRKKLLELLVKPGEQEFTGDSVLIQKK